MKRISALTAALCSTLIALSAAAPAFAQPQSNPPPQSAPMNPPQSERPAQTQRPPQTSQQTPPPRQTNPPAQQTSRPQPPQQPASDEVEEEKLSFIVGDILEITPVIDAPVTGYAWVLTEGETFLQAGRSAFFRVRFIRPATYQLHAEATMEDGTRVRRLFVVDVAARDHNETPSDAPDSAIVTTVPPLDAQNRVTLEKDMKSVSFKPVDASRRPLALDLNANVDSDDNGDPMDDNDVKDSFFASSATPLLLWLPVLNDTRELRVRSDATGGSSTVQIIKIYPQSEAIVEDIVKPSLHIVSRSIGPGTLQFNVAYDGGTPSAPTLLRWEFGDGTESLLNEPTHTYETPGAHDVTVTVRNLLTGEQMGTATLSISADAAGTSSAAGPSASVSSVGTQPSKSGSGWFWKILIILLIFLIAAGVGFVILLLLKKLRGGSSLREGLASMEKTIVQKEGAAKAPPALTFAAATPAATPKAVTATVTTVAPKPAPTPAPTPKVAPAPAPVQTQAPKEQAPAAALKADAPAPSWLQKGLDTTAKVTTPTPYPAPAPAAAPAPKAAPTPAPAGDLPPWLAAAQTQKPASTPAPAPAPAPKASEPKPAPAPVAAPTPAPTPTPAPAPKPQPAPAPAPTPAPVAPAPKPETAPAIPEWLQKANAAAAESPAPKPVATPAPAPAPAPTPAPVPTPPPAPKPTPTVTPVQPVETPKPAPAPAPVAPPKETPKPSPISPSPEVSPKPKPIPQDILPADDTTPIAFIQVDSLDKNAGDIPKA